MRTSLVALVLGAMAIGLAPIFVRLSEVGSSATAFWRVILALPVLLLWAGFSKPGDARRRGSSWGLCAVAGLLFAGDLALWHLAIGLTSVANATLEANLSAIFVTLFAWLCFGQKVTGRFLIAVAVALVGVVLLVGRNAHVSSQTLTGDALGICTAVFYSGYLLSVKAARDRGLGTARIMVMSGVITSLVLFLVTRYSGEAFWPASARGWSILLALAVISHVGGQGLIAHSLAVLPASFSAVALLVQPATATLAAWVILGESLAPAQMAGGVILLTGIWLARPGQKACPEGRAGGCRLPGPAGTACEGG